MIWIINPDKMESYQIIGINIHEQKNKPFQLWGTKPCGKTILLLEDKDEEKVINYGDAINYAIAENIKTFTL